MNACHHSNIGSRYIEKMMEDMAASDENSTVPITSSICEEPSEEAIRMYHTISWLFENVLQTGVGIAGLMANLLAIPILCSKEMSSIFNRLLVLLAVYDNFYILCSVIEAKRKSSPHNTAHEYAFAYGLYQLHNFVLCGSIFLTVALALERYRAVWRPVEYHNQCMGVNPWKRVLVSYLLPVVIFSTLFNIPKVLEVEMMVKTDWEVIKNMVWNDTLNEPIEETKTIQINRTYAAPTQLRLDEIYVVLYVNIARLLVQGIIPFICLSFLNYRIYWVMKRRRQLINRPQNSNMQAPAAVNGGGSASVVNTHHMAAQQKKANEAQQAVVLFVIVLLFFFCHTPRFVLNVHEFLTLDTLRAAIKDDCNSVSVWALSGASISHCLMTLNSSVNFFIYAFTSTTFREVMYKNVKRITPNAVLEWLEARSRNRRHEAPAPTVMTEMYPLAAKANHQQEAVANIIELKKQEEQKNNDDGLQQP